MVNIALICLDSVRKDSFYEHAHRLQEMATYEADCWAASSWSVPSHASMFTGELPSSHGAHSKNITFEHIENDSLLTSEIDTTTISVSSNRFTTEEFGFTDWFDTSISVGRTRYLPEGADMRGISDPRSLLRICSNHENSLATITNGVITKTASFIDKCPFPAPLDDGGKRVIKFALNEVSQLDDYFLFTNFMDAHGPHRQIRGHDSELITAPHTWTSSHLEIEEINKTEKPPEDLIPEDLRYYRELYNASVKYLDQIVSSFIKRLQSISSGPLVTIVTADHGENLGFESEDNLIGHSSSLSEALLQVPFLIIDPDDICDIESVDIVSHLDLKHIVRKIISEETVKISRSRSGAEILGGGLIGDESEYWNRMIRAAYCHDEKKKFVWDSLGNCRKCYISNISSQSCKSSSSIPDWCFDEFPSEIQHQETVVNDSISENTKKGLEDLGYL